MSFILFPGVPRRGSVWVVITVTSFLSLTDILDYRARGNVAECTFELKQGIRRGFQNVFIDQLEEYWLNRGWKECMKGISFVTTLRIGSIFAPLWCQLHHKGRLPLVVKGGFTDACLEQGEGSF